MISLGHCIQILSGFAFKSANFGEDGELPVVRIRDVKRGYSNTFYSGSHDRRYEINNGDLLVGMDGNFNCAYWKGGKALLNQRVCKLIADPAILDESYLYYMLGPELKRIEDKTPYATVKHLSVNKIKSIEMNLPPLQEQKRIAEILDQAEELKQKRQRTFDLLDELKQSILDQVIFSNSISSKKFGEITTKVWMGPFGSLLHKSDYIRGGTPIINPTHLTESGIKPRLDFSIGDSKLQKLARYRIKTGQIIMGRRGEMGRCALVKEESNGFLCGTGSLVIEVDATQVLAPFLNAYLSNISFKKFIEDVAVGATMLNLSSKSLNRLEIKLPSLEEQVSICDKLDGIEKLKSDVRNALKITDELFTSLQHKAFSGELSGAA